MDDLNKCWLCGNEGVSGYTAYISTNDPNTESTNVNLCYECYQMNQDFRKVFEWFVKIVNHQRRVGIQKVREEIFGDGISEQERMT
jgi:hypothetical protein